VEKERRISCEPSENRYAATVAAFFAANALPLFAAQQQEQSHNCDPPSPI